MMSQSVMTHKLKAFAISLTIFVFFAVLLGAWVKYVLYGLFFLAGWRALRAETCLVGGFRAWSTAGA
jgi:hypothetical protein